jgi:large subunit ribosomal protein L3
MKFILGTKIGMTQIFDEEGAMVPVTLVRAGPCFVTQIKQKERDGYEAVQIGFEKLNPERVKRPQKQKPFKFLREFRGRSIDLSQYKLGDEINVSIFKKGCSVSVAGVSKGKGFAGVVKRWGFAGMPASHGTKHTARGAGSTGSRFPQRVIKGRKMAGRMGGERVTVRGLKIVDVDRENNLIALKGAVPGNRKTLLELRSAD